MQPSTIPNTVGSNLMNNDNLNNPNNRSQSSSLTRQNYNSNGGPYNGGNSGEYYKGNP
jgi:hypothetical protein